MALISAEGIDKDTAASFLVFTSNNSVQVNLGDNLGANTFQVDNTTPVSVFSVDSDGDCNILGDLDVGGDINLTGGIPGVKVTNITAAKASGLNDGEYEWSFGGAEIETSDVGFLPGKPGKVTEMTLKLSQPGDTGPVIVEIQKRLVSTGAFVDSRSLTLGATVTGNSITFVTPLTFTSSEYLTFRTLTANDGKDGVMTAILEYD